MAVTPAVPNHIGEAKFPYVSNVDLTITARAGGGQALATALLAQAPIVSTVASANDSVSLPKITNRPNVLGSIGTLMFVGNAASNSMQVFGKTPDTINAVATGTGVAVAGGVNVWFVATSYNQSTNVGTWRMTNSQAAAVAAITSGTIAGVAITNSTITYSTVAPGTMTDTATVLAADILKGIIQGTPTAAANYTLPTGTLMEGAATWATNEEFHWSLINLATTDTYIISVLAGVGHTIIPTVINCPSNSATTGQVTGASIRLASRRTATNTFVTRRIA